MRYSLGTVNYSLVYSGGLDNIQITGYTDADYAECVLTRRSTTGFCFLTNETAVTWDSQRQSTVLVSTTESEYVALETGVKDAVWISSLS